MASRLGSRSLLRQTTTSSTCRPSSWLPRLNSQQRRSQAHAQPSRSYSTTLDAAALAKLPDIDPSKLEITTVSKPKDLLAPEELVFGRTFTDHMLSVEWNASEGWLAPRITPYQNLSLDPATCVFHYAFECFEGLKAYRDKQGEVRLFRPQMNMARLNRSSKRIALPTFDGLKFQELVGQFCRLEERFIPSTRGYSLYLRPTMIGTQKTLGVGPPGSALLYLIASPVGPYFPSGFKAVSLMASSASVRAWPGGVGDKKLGANYAPCIVPQMEAAAQGFHQNLWLFNFKEEDWVTEVGTMNVFIAFKTKDGGKELVTPPLDGTILEGVTRDSILSLARERLQPEGWKISERMFTMREMIEAANEGRLLEFFGAGTAAIVSPIRNVSYKGQLIDCGLKPDEEAGEIASRMKAWMEGIQYGDEEHPWSVKI